MANSYTCNINSDPNASGNMYFRGKWEFCPEYKTGDVVLHNEVMYLCVTPHAGKEPSLKDSAEYWYEIKPQSTEEDSTTITREVIDGGFASTASNDSYNEDYLVNVIDGGTSSERVIVPLV